MYKITPLVALFLFAGCEQSTENDLGVGDLDAALVVRSYPSPDERPRTQDERRTHHKVALGALAETRAIMSSSANWQEADRRLRALVAEQDGVRRRQHYALVASTRMLQPGVLPPEGADALEATGHYVEALVASRSKDTPLIADALGRLDGYWPDAQVARVAGRAADIGLEAAAATAKCEGCSLEDISQALASGIGSQEAQYAVRSVEATATLQDLAEQL